MAKKLVGEADLHLFQQNEALSNSSAISNSDSPALPEQQQKVSAESAQLKAASNKEV